jgi:hypothetical protein
VHGIRLKVGYRKYTFDLDPDMLWNISTEINGGLLQVRSLPRLLTEVIKDGFDGLSFIQSCFPA